MDQSQPPSSARGGILISSEKLEIFNVKQECLDLDDTEPQQEQEYHLLNNELDLHEPIDKTISTQKSPKNSSTLTTHVENVTNSNGNNNNISIENNKIVIKINLKNIKQSVQSKKKRKKHKKYKKQTMEMIRETQKIVSKVSVNIANEMRASASEHARHVDGNDESVMNLRAIEHGANPYQKSDTQTHRLKNKFDSILINSGLKNRKKCDQRQYSVRNNRIIHRNQLSEKIIQLSQDSVNFNYNSSLSIGSVRSAQDEQQRSSSTLHANYDIFSDGNMMLGQTLSNEAYPFFVQNQHPANAQSYACPTNGPNKRNIQQYKSIKELLGKSIPYNMSPSFEMSTFNCVDKFNNNSNFSLQCSLNEAFVGFNNKIVNSKVNVNDNGIDFERSTPTPSPYIVECNETSNELTVHNEDNEFIDINELQALMPYEKYLEQLNQRKSPVKCRRKLTQKRQVEYQRMDVRMKQQSEKQNSEKDVQVEESMREMNKTSKRKTNAAVDIETNSQTVRDKLDEKLNDKSKRPDSGQNLLSNNSKEIEDENKFNKTNSIRLKSVDRKQITNLQQSPISRSQNKQDLNKTCENKSGTDDPLVTNKINDAQIVMNNKASNADINETSKQEKIGQSNYLRIEKIQTVVEKEKSFENGSITNNSYVKENENVKPKILLRSHSQKSNDQKKEELKIEPHTENNDIIFPVKSAQNIEHVEKVQTMSEMQIKVNEPKISIRSHQKSCDQKKDEVTKIDSTAEKKDVISLVKSGETVEQMDKAHIESERKMKENESKISIKSHHKSCDQKKNEDSTEKKDVIFLLKSAQTVEPMEKAHAESEIKMKENELKIYLKSHKNQNEKGSPESGKEVPNNFNVKWCLENDNNKPSSPSKNTKKNEENDINNTEIKPRSCKRPDEGDSPESRKEVPNNSNAKSCLENDNNKPSSPTKSTKKIEENDTNNTQVEPKTVPRSRKKPDEEDSTESRKEVPNNSNVKSCLENDNIKTLSSTKNTKKIEENDIKNTQIEPKTVPRSCIKPDEGDSPESGKEVPNNFNVKSCLENANNKPSSPTKNTKKIEENDTNNTQIEPKTVPRSRKKPDEEDSTESRKEVPNNSNVKSCLENDNIETSSPTKNTKQIEKNVTSNTQIEPKTLLTSCKKQDEKGIVESEIEDPNISIVQAYLQNEGNRRLSSRNETPSTEQIKEKITNSKRIEPKILLGSIKIQNETDSIEFGKEGPSTSNVNSCLQNENNKRLSPRNKTHTQTEENDINSKQIEPKTLLRPRKNQDGKDSPESEAEDPNILNVNSCLQNENNKRLSPRNKAHSQIEENGIDGKQIEPKTLLRSRKNQDGKDSLESEAENPNILNVNSCLQNENNKRLSPRNKTDTQIEENDINSKQIEPKTLLRSRKNQDRKDSLESEAKDANTLNVNSCLQNETNKRLSPRNKAHTQIEENDIMNKQVELKTLLKSCKKQDQKDGLESEAEDPNTLKVNLCLQNENKNRMSVKKKTPKKIGESHIKSKQMEPNILARSCQIQKVDEDSIMQIPLCPDLETALQTEQNKPEESSPNIEQIETNSSEEEIHHLRPNMVFASSKAQDLKKDIPLIFSKQINEQSKETCEELKSPEKRNLRPRTGKNNSNKSTTFDHSTNQILNNNENRKLSSKDDNDSSKLCPHNDDMCKGNIIMEDMNNDMCSVTKDLIPEHRISSNSKIDHEIKNTENSKASAENSIEENRIDETSANKCITKTVENKMEKIKNTSQEVADENIEEKVDRISPIMLSQIIKNMKLEAIQNQKMQAEQEKLLKNSNNENLKSNNTKLCESKIVIPNTLFSVDEHEDLSANTVKLTFDEESTEFNFPFRSNEAESSKLGSDNGENMQPKTDDESDVMSAQISENNCERKVKPIKNDLNDTTLKPREYFQDTGLNNMEDVPRTNENENLNKLRKDTISNFLEDIGMSHNVEVNDKTNINHKQVNDTSVETGIEKVHNKTNGDLTVAHSSRSNLFEALNLFKDSKTDLSASEKIKMRKQNKINDLLLKLETLDCEQKNVEASQCTKQNVTDCSNHVEMKILISGKIDKLGFSRTINNIIDNLDTEIEDKTNEPFNNSTIENDISHRINTEEQGNNLSSNNSNESNDIVPTKTGKTKLCNSNSIDANSDSDLLTEILISLDDEKGKTISNDIKQKNEQISFFQEGMTKSEQPNDCSDPKEQELEANVMFKFDSINELDDNSDVDEILLSDNAAECAVISSFIKSANDDQTNDGNILFGDDILTETVDVNTAVQNVNNVEIVEKNENSFRRSTRINITDELINMLDNKILTSDITNVSNKGIQITNVEKAEENKSGGARKSSRIKDIEKTAEVEKIISADSIANKNKVKTANTVEKVIFIENIGNKEVKLNNDPNCINENTKTFRGNKIGSRKSLRKKNKESDTAIDVSDKTKTQQTVQHSNACIKSNTEFYASPRLEINIDLKNGDDSLHRIQNYLCGEKSTFKGKRISLRSNATNFKKKKISVQSKKMKTISKEEEKVCEITEETIPVNRIEEKQDFEMKTTRLSNEASKAPKFIPVDTNRSSESADNISNLKDEQVICKTNEEIIPEKIFKEQQDFEIKKTRRTKELIRTPKPALVNTKSPSETVERISDQKDKQETCETITEVISVNIIKGKNETEENKTLKTNEGNETRNSAIRIDTIPKHMSPSETVKNRRASQIMRKQKDLNKTLSQVCATDLVFDNNINKTTLVVGSCREKGRKRKNDKQTKETKSVKKRKKENVNKTIMSSNDSTGKQNNGDQKEVHQELKKETDKAYLCTTEEETKIDGFDKEEITNDANNKRSSDEKTTEHPYHEIDGDANNVRNNKKNSDKNDKIVFNKFLESQSSICTRSQIRRNLRNRGVITKELVGLFVQSNKKHKRNVRFMSNHFRGIKKLLEMKKDKNINRLKHTAVKRNKDGKESMGDLNKKKKNAKKVSNTKKISENTLRSCRKKSRTLTKIFAAHKEMIKSEKIVAQKMFRKKKYNAMVDIQNAISQQILKKKHDKLNSQNCELNNEKNKTDANVKNEDIELEVKCELNADVYDFQDEMETCSQDLSLPLKKCKEEIVDNVEIEKSISGNISETHSLKSATDSNEQSHNMNRTSRIAKGSLKNMKRKKSKYNKVSTDKRKAPEKSKKISHCKKESMNNVKLEKLSLEHASKCETSGNTYLAEENHSTVELSCSKSRICKTPKKSKSELKKISAVKRKVLKKSNNELIDCKEQMLNDVEIKRGKTLELGEYGTSNSSDLTENNIGEIKNKKTQASKTLKAKKSKNKTISLVKRGKSKGVSEIKEFNEKLLNNEIGKIASENISRSDGSCNIVETEDNFCTGKLSIVKIRKLKKLERNDCKLSHAKKKVLGKNRNSNIQNEQDVNEEVNIESQEQNNLSNINDLSEEKFSLKKHVAPKRNKNIKSEKKSTNKIKHQYKYSNKCEPNQINSQLVEIKKRKVNSNIKGKRIGKRVQNIVENIHAVNETKNKRAKISKIQRNLPKSSRNLKKIDKKNDCDASVTRNRFEDTKVKCTKIKNVVEKIKPQTRKYKKRKGVILKENNDSVKTNTSLDNGITDNACECDELDAGNTSKKSDSNVSEEQFVTNDEKTIVNAEMTKLETPPTDVVTTPCSECDTNVGLLENVNKDELVHYECQSNHAHICKLCRKKYKTAFRLKKHLQSQHQNEFFECDICPSCFYERDQLIHHKRLHSQVGIDCKFCGDKFQKHEIKAHLISHIQSNQRSYVTDLCFNKKQTSFLTHYLKRMKFRLECHLCLDTFCPRSNMLRHYVSRHANEKVSYSCDRCGKTFSLLQNLKRHLAIHEGVTYRCALCEKTYSRLSDYRNHVRLHAGATKFQCPVCNKCTSRLSYLKKHIVTIHSEEENKVLLSS